jgi:hypothetical protein
MDDWMEFVLAWLTVVGGTVLFMLTLRLLAWIFDGILLRGWF